MIDVKRIQALIAAAAILPLAACSSVPNPVDALDFIPGIGGSDDEGETAPDDGRITLLAFEQGLSMDENAERGPVVLPTAYSNPVWPQQGAYPTHAVQHLRTDGDLNELWRDSFGAGSGRDQRLNASPVIADGSLFMIDARGNVISANNTMKVGGPVREDLSQNFSV